MNNVQKRCQTNTPDEGKRLFSKQPAALSEQHRSGKRPSAGQRSLPQAPGPEALVQNPPAVYVWKAPTYTAFASSLWSSLLFSPSCGSYFQTVPKSWEFLPPALQWDPQPRPCCRRAPSPGLDRSWGTYPPQEVIAISRGLLAGLRPARSREGPGD